MEEIKYYSFNDIINASFIELSNQLFIDTNNNNKLGLIWAKYGSNTKINAIVTDGIIEFMSQDNDRIKKIYGINYDRDEKIFKAILIKK